MEETSKPPIHWQERVIADSVRRALDSLHGASLLSDFYLGSGTALALRLGHRQSVDLDFFSPTLFNEESLLSRCQSVPSFALAARAPHTLHAVVAETKVSFLGYPYAILAPPDAFRGVMVGGIRDIACMKVSAIASRGTKRDFVDLYTVCRSYRLAEILSWFSRKYQQTNLSRVHILKSLTWFDDADKDPMPHMLMPFAWSDVKDYFLRETPRLT